MTYIIWLVDESTGDVRSKFTTVTAYSEATTQWDRALAFCRKYRPAWRPRTQTLDEGDVPWLA